MIRVPGLRVRGEEVRLRPAECPGEQGRRLARRGPGSPGGASGYGGAPAGTSRHRGWVVSHPSLAG